MASIPEDRRYSLLDQPGDWACASAWCSIVGENILQYRRIFYQSCCACCWLLHWNFKRDTLKFVIIVYYYWTIRSLDKSSVMLKFNSCADLNNKSYRHNIIPSSQSIADFCDSSSHSSQYRYIGTCSQGHNVTACIVPQTDYCHKFPSLLHWNKADKV